MESRSPPFIGREKDLSALIGRLNDACAGSGGVVLITGEAGIGKSRLADELAQRAQERGVTVQWGHCDESEGVPAYWPWMQIARGLAGLDGADEARVGLGPAAADLALLIPEWQDIGPVPAQPRPPERDHERFRRFDSLARFLAAVAEHTPLLLILEDLHWATASALRLLLFIARQAPSMRVLIVATCPDDAVHRGPSVIRTLAELVRLPGYQRIGLDGLTKAEVGRVITAIAGAAPPAPLLQSVFERTDGNPFYVRELLSSLEPATWAEAVSGDAAALTIPATVLEVIQDHLRRLSPRCRQVLTVAAALGVEFNVAKLANVVGGPAEAAVRRLPTVLAEAERAAFIVGTAGGLGQLRFAHALTREAVYATVPASLRPELHRRIGQGLETYYGENLEAHAGELAHHFSQAAPAGDSERAITYAVRAARQAERDVAPEVGAAFYDLALQALDLAPATENGRRHALLMARGRTEVRGGQLEQARATFHEAADLARRAPNDTDRAERLAGAALGLQLTALTTGVVDARQVALLEEALSRTDPSDAALCARLLGRLAMELYYDADGGRSREISVSAVKLARRSGDAGALAYALQARRYAAWGPDTVEERLALAAEMVTLARTLNDPELAMAGHHTRFVALQEIGDMATAAEEATRQARLADELRQPYYQWHVMVYQAMRAVLDGRFDEGERLAAQAHDFGQRAEAPNAAQVFTLQVANLRWQQGRLDDAEAVLTAALDDYPSLPVWHCLRAALACARGRAADARRELDHVAGTGFTNLPTDLFWLSNMALLSETCAWLNDAACAAQLYEAIAPYATHNVMIGRAACLGPVTRYLGLLAGAMGQWARATRHVEDALAACARMGAKPLLAQTRRDLAALHERAKRTVLDAANAPQPLPAGLTARELTVLRMLAGGRSNPEIAAALSLSVKTVERHTVNIYAKIGARNRVDAAAYALRRGLA